MEIIERGSGQPLILIPGLQGRWEYLRPAVDALGVCFHVLTWSLADEPSAGAPWFYGLLRPLMRMLSSVQ